MFFLFCCCFFYFFLWSFSVSLTRTQFNIYYIPILFNVHSLSIYLCIHVSVRLSLMPIKKFWSQIGLLLLLVFYSLILKSTALSSMCKIHTHTHNEFNRMMLLPVLFLILFTCIRKKEQISTLKLARDSICPYI